MLGTKSIQLESRTSGPASTATSNASSPGVPTNDLKSRKAKPIEAHKGI
jgi:hypothetical protein